MIEMLSIPNIHNKRGSAHRASGTYPRSNNRRRAIHFATVFAAVLLVSGCAMVGPDFRKADVEVNEAWSDLEEQAISTEPAEHREWWKNFNDPVLDSLIQTACEQSLTLQVAGLRVYEARAILGVAAGTLYPQGQSVGASASRIELSENAEPISNLPPAVGSLVDTSFSNYRLGLDAAWELDFWGRFRRGVESADANLAATIATYEDVLVTTGPMAPGAACQPAQSGWTS